MKTYLSLSLLSSLLLSSSAFAGGANVISTYEQFLASFSNLTAPFVAGSAYFEASAAYSSTQSAPIASAEAKSFTIQALQEICKKEANAAIDPSSVTFQYSQGLDDAGADYGDILLHPISAFNQRQVSIQASAKCIQTGPEDSVVAALKNEQPGLFGREDSTDWLILPNELTVRVAFLSIDKNGAVTQLKNQQTPDLDVSMQWTSGNLFQQIAGKNNHFQSLNPKVVETDARGNTYFKLQLSSVKSQINSFTTGDNLVFTVGGTKTVLEDSNYIGNLDHIGSPDIVWNSNPSVFKNYFINGMFPLCRINSTAGILDCKVFIMQ